MIGDICEEVQALLAEKKCPVKVVEGPEFTKVTYEDHVVIDAGGGDAFDGPKRASHTNPKVFANRGMGLRVLAYAKVKKVGAQFGEHRNKCDHLTDMVIVALKKTATSKGYEMQLLGGDYFVLPDFQNSDNPPGCAYQLSIRWDRAIEDLDWNYDKTPEYTIGRAVMTGSPDVTFDATAKTITRSAGSWLDDGFEVGMRVTVNGTDSNDGQTAAPIATATALTLTFDTGTTFVDEGPIADAKITVGLIQTTFESETN